MLNDLVIKFRQHKTIVTTTHTQNFHISKMSVPELPSNISLPEEKFQDSLKILFILIEEIHSELTNVCLDNIQ